MDKWNRALAVQASCWLTLLGIGIGIGASGGSILAAGSNTTNPPPPVAADAAAAQRSTTGSVWVVAVTNVASVVNGTNATNATNGTVEQGTNRSDLSAVGVAEDIAARYSADILRSYLRLQEQLHATLLAIQQTRVEASAEAQTNVGAMLGRLEILEKELAGQRADEARAAHDSSLSNRLMMAAAAGMFLVGVLAMVLTAVIQARGMNRLAEIAMGLGSARGLPGLPGYPGLAAQSPLSLPGGERFLLGGAVHGANGADGADGGVAEADGGRLQSTIRQLEGRIREMETAARPGMEIKNGHAETAGSGPAVASQRGVVLARAQALMSLGQPQGALGAIDAAIAREPNEAELHLRRGMALERLKRFDQAIESFDKAIALDPRCTQAYLSKGGVLNQQSRFQEALACYEQAMEQQTQNS